MVEALTSLSEAVKQLQDEQPLQPMEVAADETIIHEQRAIIDQYMEILWPFYMGTTQ